MGCNDVGEGNLPAKLNVKLPKAQYYLGLAVLNDSISSRGG